MPVQAASKQGMDFLARDMELLSGDAKFLFISVSYGIA